jgi:hypothetical protein
MRHEGLFALQRKHMHTALPGFNEVIESDPDYQLSDTV